MVQFIYNPLWKTAKGEDKFVRLIGTFPRRAFIDLMQFLLEIGSISTYVCTIKNKFLSTCAQSKILIFLVLLIKMN